MALAEKSSLSTGNLPARPQNSAMLRPIRAFSKNLGLIKMFNIKVKIMIINQNKWKAKNN